MKTSQLILILLGFCFLVLCIFFVPQYYGAGLATESFSEGKSLLSGGKFAQADQKIRYALEQLKLSKGAIDTASINGTRATLLNASLQNAAQSPIALRILHDYRIPLTCDQKTAVAVSALQAAAEGQAPADLSQTLYAAALWAQGCKLDAESDKAYKKQLAALQTRSGNGFAEDSWLAKELSGAGYKDENYGVAIVSTDQMKKLTEPGIINEFKEVLGTFKYTTKNVLGNISPNKATKTTAETAPAPRIPSAGAAKVTTPDTSASATATQKTAARPPDAAPPAPAAKPVEQKPAPPAPAKPEAKPAPAPAKIPAKPAVPTRKPENPTFTGILSELARSGVPVSTVDYSKDRKAIIVTVRSDVKNDDLRNQLRSVLKVANQKAVVEGNDKNISSFFIYYNGKDGYRRFNMNVKVKDYQLYLDNKISGKELLDRSGQEYF